MTPDSPAPYRPPRLKLRLYLDAGTWIGPGKAELLERIGETGSISGAGRAMGMSYKRAWTLVETLNAAFAAPLVEAGRGGAGGGGARLTAQGREVAARFRAIERTAAAAAAADLAALGALADAPGDMSGRT